MACKIAQAAADDVAAQIPVGFDPTIIVTIITALLGIFKGCMQPASPAEARRQVTDGYHNGGYDHGTVRVAKHQAKRAARHAKTRISDDEANSIAVSTLDRIRLGSDEDIQEALGAGVPAVGGDETDAA